MRVSVRVSVRVHFDPYSHLTHSHSHTHGQVRHVVNGVVALCRELYFFRILHSYGVFFRSA